MTTLVVLMFLSFISGAIGLAVEDGTLNLVVTLIQWGTLLGALIVGLRMNGRG